ncbi:MAG: alpha/beta fold hydrolase [Rhodobacteraceae bacterium]|jgi:homoserine O-acetyltransferase|nr:alpha/beta fold hydrolase [Paracoccaceae bacterium]
MSTPHAIFELGDFALEGGAVLPAARLAYAVYGTPSPGRDNFVVFPTWFTGTHADLEWFIGADSALDPGRYCIVVPSMFGNGLSSSPSNTPAPFDRGRFPAVNVRDNVRAQARLMTEHFGARRIELVIGGSMGAFQAYQWALSHPGLVVRMAAMCGAARCSPHCYVFLAGAKAALTADAAWNRGDYDGPPETGMKAMGRVWAGWALSQTFYRDHLYRGMGFADPDDFLVRFWEAFWLAQDANNLLTQLHTWQTADLGATPGLGGDLGRALGAIRARALLAPAESDLYFPPVDMQRDAAAMRDARFRPIPGPFGHLSEAGIDAACKAHLVREIRALLAE